MTIRVEDRSYYPLWTRIIRDLERAKTLGEEYKGTKINCPPENIAKLKKAIIKEKDVDETWRLKRYYKLQIKAVTLGNDEVALEFKLIRYREREITTAVLIKN